jgi:transposase
LGESGQLRKKIPALRAALAGRFDTELPRRGDRRAIGRDRGAARPFRPGGPPAAVCHSILTAAWRMLQTGQTYTDPGGDFFARREPERTRKRLVGQLERLGYTVTLQEEAAPT